MTFANAVATQTVQTTNGMDAVRGTGSDVLNFFSSVGARRGRDNLTPFLSALRENEDLAIRALLWTRDVRGGAGERQTFRECLSYLCKNEYALAKGVLTKTAEVGRWDDLLVAEGTIAEAFAFGLISEALVQKNGLCAKWMPRKGAVANKLRNFLQMTPKQYRKTLVTLTQVVETQMCANAWDNIEVAKVPSLATIRYRKAFARHIPEKITQFAKQVAAGEVKVNAAAVYPHQIVQEVRFSGLSQDQHAIAQGQWDNLPNYVPEGSSVIPMVDVSGSMEQPAGGSSTTCMTVAISLGLYLAEKNTGAFKDLFLTFSSETELVKLNGANLKDRVRELETAPWKMSTNVMRAFQKILKVAVDANLPKEDMPKTLIIFSDMQFDRCAAYTGTAYKQVKQLYADAGYDAPRVVFWNLNDYDNKAATKDELGAALVSGFSPSLLKSVLSNDLEEFTPYGVMLSTLCVERYNW